MKENLPSTVEYSKNNFYQLETTRYRQPAPEAALAAIGGVLRLFACSLFRQKERKFIDEPRRHNKKGEIVCRLNAAKNKNCSHTQHKKSIAKISSSSSEIVFLVVPRKLDYLNWTPRSQTKPLKCEKTFSFAQRVEFNFAKSVSWTSTAVHGGDEDICIIGVGSGMRFSNKKVNFLCRSQFWDSNKLSFEIYACLDMNFAANILVNGWRKRVH